MATQNLGRVGIVLKGTWNSALEYTALDLVSYDGNSWVAKKTSTNVEPTTENSEFWQLISNNSDLVATVQGYKEDAEAAATAAEADSVLGAQAQAAIAPTFSASTSYTEGQIVWYSGTLYKFTQDHAAGAWTGTDATTDILGNEISELKSALNKLAEDGEEVIDREITWAVGAISNGQIDTSQTTYRYTEDLLTAEVVTSTLIDTALDVEVYVYNSDQTYFGRRSNVPAGSTEYEITDTFLANKPYVRFVIKADGLSSFKAYYYAKMLATKSDLDTTASNLAPINGITESETKAVASKAILSAFESLGSVRQKSGSPVRIDDGIAIQAEYTGLATGEKLIQCGVNIWDEQWENGYYNQDDGSEQSYSGRIRTKNPIRVVPGKTMYVVTSDSISILGWGSDGTTYKGPLHDRGSGSFSVPSDVYFIKFYCSSAYGGTYKNDTCISFEDTTYRKSAGVNEYQSGDTLALLGGVNYLYGSAGSTLTITYYKIEMGGGSSVNGLMPKIKLLSYNIRCLRGGDAEAGYDALTTEQINTTLANFKDLFQKIQPDVFVVCEDRTYFDAGAFATTGGTRSVYTELFEHYFPYRYNQSTGANEPHIYSKYPLHDTQRIDVSYGEGVSDTRKPPAARIVVGGYDIWIVGAHPMSDASAYTDHRIPYFNAIISFAADKDHLFACGDFNTDSASPETELAPFETAGMELGNMGYFGKFQTYRWGTAVYIDNIVTKGMTLNDFTVGNETYSDHFPVFGELNLRL